LHLIVLDTVALIEVKLAEVRKRTKTTAYGQSVQLPYCMAAVMIVCVCPRSSAWQRASNQRDIIRSLVNISMSLRTHLLEARSALVLRKLLCCTHSCWAFQSLQRDQELGFVGSRDRFADSRSPPRHREPEPGFRRFMTMRRCWLPD